MTEIRNNAPQQDRENSVSITLTEQKARKIEFRKPCLDSLTILRKINDGNWQILAKDVRLPFIDDETFEDPVHLEYHIKLYHTDRTTDDYYLKSSIH